VTSSPIAPPAVFTLTAHVFVRNGREDAFRERLPGINGRCAGVTGFLGMGADTDRPGPESTRWALSYKFSSQEGRDACQALLGEEFDGAGDLVTAPPVFDAGDRVGERRPVEAITIQIP